MKKLLSIMAFIFLLPVFAHAAETNEAKCNSADDCFDKMHYLFFEKKDNDKWRKYALKGCTQYNHVVSCLFYSMFTEEINKDVGTPDEVVKKAAKQDFPYALFDLRSSQDDFQEFWDAIRNDKLKQFLASDNGADKILNFSKDFLKICQKQNDLHTGNTFINKAKIKMYYKVSSHMFDTSIAISPTLQKLKSKENNKAFIIKNGKYNVINGLYYGLKGFSTGTCADWILVVNNLEYYIKIEKKYEDL